MAVFFRSVALFAILYQLRLIAGDLADTAVFTTVLSSAFAAAIFFSRVFLRGRMKAPAAAGVLLLLPLVARVLIEIPRIFVPAGDTAANEAAALYFDSLLLHFDRNIFVSLLPFYWASITTWFSAVPTGVKPACSSPGVNPRKFLRAAVIADAVILIVILTSAGIADLPEYRWPVVMIVLLAGIVFLQALAFLFSVEPEIRLGKNEKITSIAVFFILILAGSLVLLKPLQQKAAQKGGGLLEPKLFSFDFSQILRLDSEISMNDDLILIVRKDPGDSHTLLRRAVLSGYGKKQGFFRIEDMDEKTHPQRLPASPVRLTPYQSSETEIKSAQQVKQEYFLVNFDSSAFIGMKKPLEIIPYENWDSSSFKSAYAVESLTTTADIASAFPSPLLANDLSRLIYGDDDFPTATALGLSEKEFALYTAFGQDDRIKSLAEEITAGHDLYSEKVMLIHDWLKYGDYRYSLKPGIAPDGDQLAWFLFQSKKGYCSYYAFAMALMLRSLGIPARVAAGFFIDPDSSVFDYYPVRSDMAHAWVEVLFPGYGWLEFDPTTESLAAGEEFRFSAGADPDLLERLMREILENRSKLRAKTGQLHNFSEPGFWENFSVKLIKNVFFPLALLALPLLFLLIRCGYFLLSIFYHDPRKKAVCLWKHTRRRLMLAGFSRLRRQAPSEPEWALYCDTAMKAASGAVYAMYLGAAAARFAPVYHAEDFAALQKTYRQFSALYRKTVPLFRRFLAWFAPPLALMVKRSGDVIMSCKQFISIMMVFLFALLAVMDSGAQNSQGVADDLASADELYSGAAEAEYAEFWERAIELYREGAAAYPDDPRFPWALGNLFYSRSLYSLAWDEYRKAELISPYNTHILSRLANTAGYLNRNETSVEYFERVLAIDPGNREAVSRLGWMYFKVHRLDDGERLLLDAIEHFGDDPDLSMTLGTVYSDMYRYTEGKHWYKNAIAQSDLYHGSAAVAHYNLSILESRFYRYDLSMDETNASLDSLYRASGLLMRGELMMRRLDLEQAQADYEAAREIDYSPLAKLSLAQAYQVCGRLQEALVYARNCLRDSDHSWMMNFGIDPIRYKRDIHEILYETYSGLVKAEKFRPGRILPDHALAVCRSLSFRFYSAVHRLMYQKYSLASGNAYGDESHGSPPRDRCIQYYNAFQTYPRRGRVWLAKARNFETALIPASQPSYDLEEGILLKNKPLVLAALEKFDPVWERDMIALCCRELAKNPVSLPEVRRMAAAELFSMNRGSLMQEGIRLPVAVTLHFPDAGAPGKPSKILWRALAKTGFSLDNNARFILDIAISGSPAEGYAARCGLLDSENAAESLYRSFPVRSLAKKELFSLAIALNNAIFTVP